MSRYGGYTAGKRDKSKMMRNANEKISQREAVDAEINSYRFDNRMDIDRIMLERQLTSHNFSDSEDDRYVGELTGEEVNKFDIFDQGMPVRSSFSVKRSKYDNNSHLDFDLFSKVDNRELNDVGYSDNGGDYAILDEAMKPITSGSNPYETCVMDVNSTTCWMHSNMYHISKEDYIVNGLGLFSAFGVIYLISTGNTELELKNYFGYQDKRHLNAGLLTIREDINRYRNQLIIDNYIINDKNIPSMGNTAQKLKKLIFNIVINRDYAEQEAERVNNIIKTVSRMSNVVSANTISLSDISLITVAKLTPIWAYKIDQIVKSNSHSKSNTKSNSNSNTESNAPSFIKFIGKTFDYYEDAERQIVEVPLYERSNHTDDSILVIGLVINKRGMQESTELKVLTTALNYMKPTVLDELMIPIIKKRYKTRLNKTLQKTGLNVTFMEQDMSGLFPEGGTINDCLQYVDINFGTKSGNKRCNNNGYRTTRKFICNTTFEFYLRNTKTNCIMMFGRL